MSPYGPFSAMNFSWMGFVILPLRTSWYDMDLRTDCVGLSLLIRALMTHWWLNAENLLVS
jgi:hypothetical protein